jgi:hypothetical protein
MNKTTVTTKSVFFGSRAIWTWLIYSVITVMIIITMIVAWNTLIKVLRSSVVTVMDYVATEGKEPLYFMFWSQYYFH